MLFSNLYLDRKSFHPALPISQLWLMTFIFDDYLPLLHKTQVSEQIHCRLLLPCLPSLPLPSFPPPIHRDADLQKPGLQEMLFIPRKLISSLLKKSSGLLLCLSIMSSFDSIVSGCSRLKTGLQQIKVLNTKLLAYMILTNRSFTLSVLPLPCWLEIWV